MEHLIRTEVYRKELARLMVEQKPDLVSKILASNS